MWDRRIRRLSSNFGRNPQEEKNGRAEFSSTSSNDEDLEEDKVEENIHRNSEDSNFRRRGRTLSDSRYRQRTSSYKKGSRESLVFSPSSSSVITKIVPEESKVNFLLVFLLGIVTALLAVSVFSYHADLLARIMKHRETFSPLPDIAHMAVVEETSIFSNRKPMTELQRPKSSALLKKNGVEVEEEERSLKECDGEAVKTLEAAVRSHGRSQNSRASKLFKHALALCPRHPSVLIGYGEFLEDSSHGEADLVRADAMFVRAIAFSDDNSSDRVRALANRQRTSVAVEEIDRSVLKRIDSKKKKFQRASERQSPSMKRAKKEAYYQHIYHTIGIEGSTMTLAQTRSILETRLAVGGKSIVENNEVIGMDEALKYINRTLVDKPGEITLKDILEIHRRVIGHVDPVEAGFMRRTQVYVGDYVPPQPAHIDVLMHRFVEWLNSAGNSLDMHPVRFAALAHYKLVYIHPFVDGNGRTSRLLMNLILMQSGYPPVIVRKQDRLRYYQTLVQANEGDIRPFVRFIAECTERTLDAYIAATQNEDNSNGKAGNIDTNGVIADFFGDGKEMVIATDPQGHFEYHEAIMMGGTLGPNITVSP